jgi:hypothetical protein
MRIVFQLCLLLTCGTMWSELALAASHGHRPNASASRPAPAGDDTGKSTVTPAGPAETTPPPSAAGGKAGDAPIDTSITVNQGHRILTGKEAAAKKLTTALGKPVPGQAKPHPPAHPLTAHLPPPRNALGAVAQHADPHAATKRAGTETGAAAAGASTPAASAAHLGATATAPATPAAREPGGTATPARKTPVATAAEHGAAALRAMTANGPSINGTGVARPSTATAAVGGPAKSVAAAVGGASIRPKHP